MTTTRSLTVPVTRSSAPVETRGAKPCRCGCCHEEICCELDCLERPRFFCGQLLTDQDLTDLVGWSQDKLRLARYRHGWGVVCGLEAHCDPESPAGVLVAPGYALSCCGDDIIVCEETSVDLSAACKPEEDPCADLTASTGGQADDTHVFVDLAIRYREEDADLRASLGTTVCREVADCEPSRIRESYELVWEPALPESDPLDLAAERWRTGFNRCSDVVERLLKQFGELSQEDYTDREAQNEAVRRWLLRWIEDHPPHQFCFVRDWICDPGHRPLTEILLALVVDCRNAYVRCTCAGCEVGAGVPLARVCLSRFDAQGDPACRVVSLDPYPPFRRELAPACWPAPLGHVNLARFLWRREEEVCAALHELGVKVQGVRELVVPNAVENLQGALEFDPFLPCGSEVTLLVGEPPREAWLPPGERVIGFRRTGRETTDKSTVPASPSEEVRESNDLTRLDNIANGRQKTLREAGIRTFAELAETPDDRLQELFPRVKKETISGWRADAAKLARGEETE